MRRSTARVLGLRPPGDGRPPCARSAVAGARTAVGRECTRTRNTSARPCRRVTASCRATPRKLRGDGGEVLRRGARQRGYELAFVGDVTRRKGPPRRPSLWGSAGLERARVRGWRSSGLFSGFTHDYGVAVQARTKWCAGPHVGRAEVEGANNGLSQSTIRALRRIGGGPSAGRNRGTGLKVRGPITQTWVTALTASGQPLLGSLAGRFSGRKSVMARRPAVPLLAAADRSSRLARARRAHRRVCELGP